MTLSAVANALGRRMRLPGARAVRDTQLVSELPEAVPQTGMPSIWRSCVLDGGHVERARDERFSETFPFDVEVFLGEEAPTVEREKVVEVLRRSTSAFDQR